MPEPKLSNTVVITIEGGAHELLERPKDVRVVVADFDIDGVDIENLSIFDGRPCILHEYEA